MGAKKRIKLSVVTLLFASVCAVSSQEPSVQIKPEDPSLTKPAGVSLAFTCTGTAENVELFDNMRWFGPNGEISTRETDNIYSSTVEPGKMLLIFSNPTPEDSGKYNCTAVYANTIHREDTVAITFYHSITWDDCNEQQSVVVGKEGYIRCLVNANPAPTVTWYRNGAKLDQVERMTVRNDGIYIPEVRESDAGEYSARAMVESTGSMKWRKISVEVHVPPEITELSPKYSFVVGERSEMSCQAKGFPTPKIYWFHEKTGRNLSEAEGYFVNTESGVVTIQSVRREDNGEFSCRAVNSAATDSRSTVVSVIVKPEVKEFLNKTIVKGQDITMECRVSGDPRPEITMRKDGNDRAFQNGDDRIRLDRREDGEDEILVFTIQGVERSDDGLYYCAAKNQGGNVEQVGHLTVEFAPDMSSTPSDDVKTWKENPVNLTCVALAIPNATITWTFRSREIVNNEIYRIYSGASVSSLLVKPIHMLGGNDVYGFYRCDARNTIGNSSIEIKLTEAREPGVLQQYSIERHTATTVTFMLRGPKDDGGLPVRAFVVEYGERDMPVTARENREWSEGTSYILEKLKPRTAYIFRFAARNDAGIGPWSLETDFIMPTESTPEVPNFMIPGGTNTSSFPDSFMVRWSVPQDNGKPIDYFVLRYFEVERESNEWKSVSQDRTEKITDWENAPRFMINGLRPNTQYKVEIRAHNEIGNSQPASMIFRTATGSVTEERTHNDDSSNLTTAAIVAIIIVVVLVILGLLDATCYLRYHCGVFYCLRTAVCGRSPSSEKVKDGTIEDGGKGKEKHQNDPNGRKHMDISDELEDSPMIVGAKDTKANDVSNEDLKNKSPKGSKSSIAKDSLV